ncbi:hypothetical protein [Abyssalbus ytuae]|uniref:Uncharacterized protein n=1 Tax=Abyssalbus ytuae TaxID=2926907 RepID=A0A9E6ZPM9_9FLAO|nr:hypothetical protein [Abyssalbus ytuae]UOB18589.1 hypothetical protein MQE35_04695 [Abyssalbus ytuae]
MDKIEKIKQHLEASKNHFITIINTDNKRLGKDTSFNKFLWSKEDINSSSGTIDNFLKSLPQKGIKSGSKLHLRVTHGNTFRTIGEVNLLFKDSPQQTPEKTNQSPMSTGFNNNQQQKQENNPAPVYPSLGSPMQNIGLGFTPVPISEYTDLKVLSQRYEDVKTKLKETVQELLDAKSELRIANEKNSSLQLKLDTVEAKHSIEIDRKEMEKKSFLDSEAGLKAMEALGAALPAILSRQQPAVSVGQGMGNPYQGISEIKQHFIDAIAKDQEINDEHLNIIYEGLTAIKKVEGFQAELVKLINYAKQELNG